MPQALKTFVEQEKENIFLLFGEEPLLAEEALSELKELMNPDLMELNIQVIDKKNPDVQQLTEMLEAVPFMDRFRLVVVRSVEFFLTGDKGLGKQEEEALLKYLADPSPSTILLFMPQEVDKRSILYKKLKKNYLVMETKRLDKNELRKWCQRECKAQKFEMQETLLDLFIRRSGYLQKEARRDLRFMRQELSKLAALSKSKQKLKREDIEDLLLQSTESDIFKFTDWILQGKKEEALRMYRERTAEGESPLAFLSMMGRQLALLGRCHLLKIQGYSSSGIAQQLDLHPYAAKKAFENTSRLSLEHSKQMLRACLDTELRIKTGRLREDIGVELIMMRLWQAQEGDETVERTKK